MLKLVKANYSKLSKNDFVKGVATLATGTAISQIIPLLLAPLISRLYNPSDYAILAAYSSITILLTIIATGMYDTALMLDKEDVNAINTGSVAILITIIITIISAIIMFTMRNNIAEMIGNKEVSFWLYLVPFTVFFHGFYQTLNLWNNRKGRYKRLATNRIVMTSITTSLTIALGYFSFHEKGLVISLIVGQGVSFIILFIQTIKSDKLLFVFISRVQMKKAYKLHIDFPRYNMPQGFLDGLKEGSLVWIISFYFGNVALGSFSFARSIIMRPLQIIGSSVGQVFYQKASEIYNERGDILNISKKTFLNLFFMGLPFAIIMFLWGENIFKFVFSSRWKEAGKLTQILIFWLLLSFVASPLSTIPLIIKTQKQFFIWSLISNILPILVLYLFCRFSFNFSTTMVAFSVSNIVLLILIFIWLYYCIRLRNVNVFE